MTTLEELIADSWFPFAGDITVKPLEPPVLPEPPRHGVEAADCHSCSRADDSYVWTDDSWRLTAYLPTQVRGIVLLETRAHLDSFTDFPDDLLAALGPMTARVERAVAEALGDVARVHVCRWGDGGAHFHLWFMPRPLGALQLRGSMLPMWLDVLPDLDDDVARAAVADIGRTLAESGGTAHLA
jgi:diadenosine tetraphosphate (Ap4A) HIT family hydrolase